MVAKKKAKKGVAKKKALKKRPVKRIPKKKAVKKAARKRIAKKKVPAAKKAPKSGKKEGVIGLVTHYFPQVRAAVIKLKAPLSAGDTIKVKGHTTDFTQAVTSMQINHVPVNSAKKGAEIGLLVESRVRQHDKVYKA